MRGKKLDRVGVEFLRIRRGSNEDAGANQDYASGGSGHESVVAFYEREIREAQAIGIDGFALNAGGWSKEPRYILRASEMFEAAYRLHSSFKLMFSADMCCSNDAAYVEDMIRRFANNRRYSTVYFTWKGRFVLTTFAGERRGPEFWRQLRSDLEQGSHPSVLNAQDVLSDASGISSSAPLPIYLVSAFFWGGELPQLNDIGRGPHKCDCTGAGILTAVVSAPSLRK
jgi:hypothetical protein